MINKRKYMKWHNLGLTSQYTPSMHMDYEDTPSEMIPEMIEEHETSWTKGKFFGKLLAFQTYLKLTHWSITGEGSYVIHKAIDEAWYEMHNLLDKLVETSLTHDEEIEFIIPQIRKDISILECCDMICYKIHKFKPEFSEYQQGILEQYQCVLREMMYKIMRLS